MSAQAIDSRPNLQVVESKPATGTPDALPPISIADRQAKATVQANRPGWMRNPLSGFTALAGGAKERVVGLFTPADKGQVQPDKPIAEPEAWKPNPKFMLPENQPPLKVEDLVAAERFGALPPDVLQRGFEDAHAQALAIDVAHAQGNKYLADALASSLVQEHPDVANSQTSIPVLRQTKPDSFGPNAKPHIEGQTPEEIAAAERYAAWIAAEQEKYKPKAEENQQKEEQAQVLQRQYVDTPSEGNTITPDGMLTPRQTPEANSVSNEKFPPMTNRDAPTLPGIAPVEQNTDAHARIISPAELLPPTPSLPMQEAITIDPVIDQDAQTAPFIRTPEQTLQQAKAPNAVEDLDDMKTQDFVRVAQEATIAPQPPIVPERTSVDSAIDAAMSYGGDDTIKGERKPGQPYTPIEIPQAKVPESGVPIAGVPMETPMIYGGDDTVQGVRSPGQPYRLGEVQQAPQQAGAPANPDSGVHFDDRPTEPFIRAPQVATSPNKEVPPTAPEAPKSAQEQADATFAEYLAKLNAVNNEAAAKRIGITDVNLLMQQSDELQKTIDQLASEFVRNPANRAIAEAHSENLSLKNALYKLEQEEKQALQRADTLPPTVDVAPQPLDKVALAMDLQYKQNPDKIRKMAQEGYEPAVDAVKRADDLARAQREANRGERVAGGADAAAAFQQREAKQAAEWNNPSQRPEARVENHEVERVMSPQYIDSQEVIRMTTDPDYTAIRQETLAREFHGIDLEALQTTSPDRALALRKRLDERAQEAYRKAHPDRITQYRTDAQTRFANIAKDPSFARIMDRDKAQSQAENRPPANTPALLEQFVQEDPEKAFQYVANNPYLEVIHNEFINTVDVNTLSESAKKYVLEQRAIRKVEAERPAPVQMRRMRNGRERPIRPVSAPERTPTPINEEAAKDQQAVEAAQDATLAADIKSIMEKAGTATREDLKNLTDAQYAIFKKLSAEYVAAGNTDAGGTEEDKPMTTTQKILMGMIIAILGPMFLVNKAVEKATAA